MRNARKQEKNTLQVSVEPPRNTWDLPKISDAVAPSSWHDDVLRAGVFAIKLTVGVRAATGASDAGCMTCKGSLSLMGTLPWALQHQKAQSDAKLKKHAGKQV